jgi:hypothetical protein
MFDLIQKLAGMLAAIVGLLYIAGGVIVNLYLSRFGVSEYKILKAKYLAVGLNFLISLSLFISVVGIIAVFIVPVGSPVDLQVRLIISTITLCCFTILYYSQRFRSCLKRLWSRIFKCVDQKISYQFWVFGVMGISLYPVSFAHSYAWATNNIQQIELYIGLAMLYSIVGLAILTFYFGIELYASPIPAGPSATDFMGTGKIQRIRMVGRAEDFELLEKLGIALEFPELTAEVGLIDETDDYYLIVIENEKRERAVKIYKDLVKGISYRKALEKK